jgi:tetratricopeptide (TPR) repeat protein
MWPHMRWLTVVLVLLVSLRLAAAPPSAEKRAEAKLHYENGLRKFDVGKYDEAAEEFQSAYELIGDPVILYNIAQSFRVAQKYDKALLFYKNYLRRTGNPGNRGEVEQRIAEITAVLEQQKRATEAPPTGPIKSGEPTEKPPEPEPKPEVKPVEPPPIPPPPPERPKNARTLKITGIALLAVTAVSLGVGIGMSVAAGQASSDVEAAARSKVEFTPELRNKDADGRTFDVVGIAFYAVAGVCAVAGGVTLGLGLKGERAARASIAPVFGPSSAGIAVSGRF